VEAAPCNPFHELSAVTWARRTDWNLIPCLPDLFIDQMRIASWANEDAGSEFMVSEITGHRRTASPRHPRNIHDLVTLSRDSPKSWCRQKTPNRELEGDADNRLRRPPSLPARANAANVGIVCATRIAFWTVSVGLWRRASKEGTQSNLLSHHGM